MAGQQLTFPKLSVGQLIEGFRVELGPDFDVHEEDIKQPTKERWVRLYCYLLAFMTDNDVDELTTRLRCVDHEIFDYPALYSESQLLMNLAKFMAEMMVHCKIYDFTAEDIILPDKKRLTMILSAILNFVRHRTHRKQEFEHLVRKMDSQVEERDALRQELEDWKKKIEVAQKQQAVEKEELKRVAGQIELAVPRLEQVRKRSNELDQAIVEANVRLNNRKHESQKRQERIAKLKAEIAEYDEQLVKSPERFQTEIGELEKKLERLDAVLREKQEQEKKLLALYNPQLGSEWQQVLKELSAASEADKKRRKQEVELSSAKDRVRELEETAASLKRDIEMLSKQINLKQDKIDKADAHHRLELEQTELQLQKQTEEDEKNKDLEQLKKVDDRRREVQLDLQRAKNSHEERMEGLREDYSILITEFENYNKRVLSAMEKVIPDELRETLKLAEEGEEQK